MSHYKAPLRDMRFLMNEVLDYPAHYASLPNGKDADPETVDAILEGAAQLCEEVLAPLNHSGDEDAAHHDPVGRVERVLQEDRPELPDHRGDEDENGWEDDPGQRDKQHEPYGHRVPREVALLRPVVQLLPELVLVHRLGDVWRHASCLAWAEAGIDLVAVARISGDVATLTEGKTWRVVVCHTYSVTQVYRDEMLTS